MNRRKLLVDVAIVIAILAIVAGLTLPSIYDSSNCGGNSAALAAVRTSMLIVQRAAAESPNHRFDITSAPREVCEDLAHQAWGPFLGNAQILISSIPYDEHLPGPRRVLFVCDTPFRNVPRSLLLPPPATHAASYTDGSTALISVAEFKALDRSSFRSVRELFGHVKD